MPSNVTLGFDFNSQPAQSSLSAFSKALANALSGVETNVAKMREQLGKIVPPDVANNITAIKTAVEGIKGLVISEDSARGLTTIAAAVAKMDKLTGNGVQSLKELRDTLEHMPTDVTKISAGITGVVDAFGGLESVRADSVKAMASVMAATAKLAEQQRSVSPALSAMRQSLNALFRDITRAQVPTEKLESIASFTRSMRGIATENAGINITSSFAAISNSILNLQASLQNFTITDEQANSLVAVAKLAKAMSNFDTAAASNATLLGEALNSITASTANINIDLSQVNTIVQLAKAIRNIPADAPAKGEAVAGLFAALANAAPAASNLSRAASELASLGAAIRRIPSGNAAVANIAKLFDVLQGLEARFRSLNLSGTADQFTLLGQSLRGLKVSKANANNLEKVINLLAGFRPLPPESLSSIRTLTDLLQALGHAAVGSTSAMREHTMSLRQVRNEMTGTTMLVQGFTSILSTQFLKQSVVDAAAFGRELAYINTIAKEFRDADLGSSFLNMASYLGNARSLANSFYYAYSSGVRGTQEEMMAFTESMAMTSQLIRADVTPTINAVTGMMNAYGMSVGEADRVSRMLFNTIKYGKALGSELAGSLGMVTPTAAIAKIPIEELGAALASLTRVMPTANAITALNNLITKIIRPTSDAARMAKIYGVELSLAALQSDGLLGTLRKLHDALGDNQDAIAKIFPDIRGIRAAFTLLGNGFDEFEGFTRQFQQDTKSVEDASEQLKNDINYQLGAIPDTISRIRTEAGGMLISILEPATPLIRAFNEMGEFWRKSISLLALVGAGWTTLKVGMMAVQVLQKRAEQLAANEHQAAINRVGDIDKITQALHQQISAETSLSTRRASLLNGAAMGAKLDPAQFKELYLDGDASSGKGMSMIASLSAQKKALAQNVQQLAYHNVELKNQALAVKNTALATIYATEAQKQWQRYLSLSATTEKLDIANKKILARQRLIEIKQLQKVNATMRERLKLQAQILGLSTANLGQGILIAGVDKLQTGFSALAAAAGAFLKTLMSMAIWTAALWAVGEGIKALVGWLNKAKMASDELLKRMSELSSMSKKQSDAEISKNQKRLDILAKIQEFNGMELTPDVYAGFKGQIVELEREFGLFGAVLDDANRKIFISQSTFENLADRSMKNTVASLRQTRSEYVSEIKELNKYFELQNPFGGNYNTYQLVRNARRVYQKLSDELGKEESKYGYADRLVPFRTTLGNALNLNANKKWFNLASLKITNGIDIERMEKLAGRYLELRDAIYEIDQQTRQVLADDLNRRAEQFRKATKELIDARLEFKRIQRDFTESLFTDRQRINYDMSVISAAERRMQAEHLQSRTGNASERAKALIREQQLENIILSKRVEIFNLQRKMAKEQFQSQKQAYENTVKMVMEMDKFKARTANTFEVGTWEAVELMSRRFENLGALPEIKLPEDQTVSLAANPQLAKLIDINTAIAAGLKGTEGGQYDWNKLWLGENFQMEYIKALGMDKIAQDMDFAASQMSEVASMLQGLINKQMADNGGGKIFASQEARTFSKELAGDIGVEIERRGVKLVVKPVGR